MKNTLNKRILLNVNPISVQPKEMETDVNPWDTSTADFSWRKKPFSQHLTSSLCCDTGFLCVISK